MTLNLTSAVIGCRAVLPAMTAAGAGRIVNIASRAVVPPLGGFIAYTVAKAGVITLTQALAREVERGITVNAVLPSTMDTPGNRHGHARRRPLRVGQHRRGRRGDRLPRLRARRDDLGRGDPGVTTPIGRRRLAPMRAASIALVTAALLASGCASAPSPASAPPRRSRRRARDGRRAPASPAGELQKPIRQVLPNGLRLIVQDHRAADIVAVYLYVGVGVRYEKPDELGFAHFQEHMLFKGTDKWGPGYIDRAVEGVGGRTNATTSFDYTDFYIVVPADALEMAVQTLADMAFRSTFDPEEVERERQVIFEEANIEADNPRTAIVRDSSTASSSPTIPTATLRWERPRP